MNKKQCCVRCEFCSVNELGDLICVNIDSEQCGNFVEFDMICNYFKENTKDE